MNSVIDERPKREREMWNPILQLWEKKLRTQHCWQSIAEMNKWSIHINLAISQQLTVFCQCVTSCSLRVSGVSESRESWEPWSLRTMNCTIGILILSSNFLGRQSSLLCTVIPTMVQCLRFSINVRHLSHNFFFWISAVPAVKTSVGAVAKNT